MRIIIKKQGWLKQKFKAEIITDQGIVFESKSISNLTKLEDTIKRLQKEINKCTIIYENITEY